MQTSAVITRAPATPLDRSMIRMHTFLCVIALLLWWEVAFRQGATLGAGTRTGAALAATFMVVARVASNACEALFYTLWWRTRGARLPYARFLAGLVALSLVDLLAQGLSDLAQRAPALVPWLAPLAGLHLLRDRWPGLEPGVWSALGSLGLLTLARLTMTAWLQAWGLGRRLGGPLLVTAAAWLVTRVVLWWTLDLFRGMSPLR